jgi:sulfoquinovosyltransferase
VWQRGVDTDVFNPHHKSAAMRARMSDGHPEEPLLVYVGRLGAEKNTEALKDILVQVRSMIALCRNRNNAFF